MHKGFDSTLDSQTPVVVGFPDPAYAISAGQQKNGGVFGSGRDSQDTFVSVAFKPGQSEASTTTVVAIQERAVCENPDAGSDGVGVGWKGTTCSIGFNWQNGGGYGNANDMVCTPIDLRQASRGDKDTNNRTTGSGGPPGHGVGDEGDPAFTVSERGQAIAFKPGQSEAAGGTFVTEEFTPTMQAQNNGSTAVPAVAFKPSHYTRGKDGAPSEVVAPLSADADKGDQDTVVAFAFAQNQLGEVRVNSDVMGTVNQNQNASGRNTPMVCGFSPLQGGRSMPVTQESPTLEAGTGNKTPAIAFTERGRGGGLSCEYQDDVSYALKNPGAVGRSNDRMIQTHMQVRRLCPSECEALQGFPIGYTDVQYRKKPAADGPRYRALGNSMAVPCMWWLGHRISLATSQDTE